MSAKNHEPCAILLAGGLSSRSGPVHKLARLMNGKTVLAHQIDVLKALPIKNKIVVLNEKTQQLAPQPAEAGIIRVINSDPAQGLMSSIQLAIKASPPSSGFLISLADLIELKVKHFTTVLKAADEARFEKLIAPFYQGQRGHPVFVPIHYANEILELKPSDKGLKFLWNKYPTLDLQVSEVAYVKDSDF